jgi:hypothetical protein
LKPLACELHGMRGQPFSELENCDPVLGAYAGGLGRYGQEQGEFAWLHIDP